MQYPHIKKAVKNTGKSFSNFLCFFFFYPCAEQVGKAIFMHSLHTMCKWILFLENVTALFPCFLLCYEKKAILQIYMCCSAALEMHIHQRIRFRAWRGSLNSWEVETRRRLLTSISLGFIKAVSIATSFSQDPEMLCFIF